MTGRSPFPDPREVVAEPTRRQRLRGPVLTAGVVGAFTLALHLRDPHVSGSWGGCPWLALTGQYCPGCGGLRAVNDLTNGDLVAAASSNLVFVLAVPVLVLWWLRWARREWSGGHSSTQGQPQAQTAVRTNRHTRWWVALVVLLVVVFTVLRNLAWGAWLAP